MNIALRESRLLNDAFCVRKPSFGQKLQRKFPFVLSQPKKLEITETSCLRKRRKVHFLCNEFWEIWRKAYLSQMQQRLKWQRDKRDLQIGEVVPITDESLPQCQWKLDRVFEVNPGS